MPPKFGTSGLRGLAVELTSELVGGYAAAFLAACPAGGKVFVGRDLRASSPRISADVIAAIRVTGTDVVDCGVLPTPALALVAMEAGAAAVMVTGSHIPADRNGLKFYVPTGEISKADEAAISAALVSGTPRLPAAARPGILTEAPEAVCAYVARYANAFGPQALTGARIGIYQHSSVARTAMVDIIRALGGTAVPLAPSGSFIPVDTEAVDGQTRAMLATWCNEHKLDAVISTDGDADRPMLTDAMGQVVPGDILGAITARTLGARMVCTPVSSNTMVSRMPDFARVDLTRIGSPYVIAAMEALLDADPAAAVVGFEPNGGFLLGFRAAAPAGPLTPLMTRDSLLPMVTVLTAARANGASIADLLAALPARRTASDRLQQVSTDISAAFLARLTADPVARAAFLAPAGREAGCDLTDGLRITLDGGAIVHLRPSGNAPEFRIYTEADTASEAASLLQVAMARIREELAIL